MRGFRYSDIMQLVFDRDGFLGRRLGGSAKGSLIDLTDPWRWKLGSWLECVPSMSLFRVAFCVMKMDNTCARSMSLHCSVQILVQYEWVCRIRA